MNRIVLFSVIAASFIVSHSNHAIARKAVLGAASMATAIGTALLAKEQLTRDNNTELIKKMIAGRSLYKKWQENPNLTLSEISKYGTAPRFPLLEQWSIFIQGHLPTIGYATATALLYVTGIKLLTTK